MTPLIPAATMVRLRAVDEAAMPSACRVLRRTRTVVGGRVAYGDAVAIASVDCRLEPRGKPGSSGAQELEAIGRLGMESLAVVMVPLGTPVQSKDAIEVTTGWAVTTFEVIGDPVAESYATSLAVAVQLES